MRASIIISLLVVFTAVSAQQIQIELFTESLCPDCIQFVTTSLASAINATDLFTMANITIYPYGNAFERQSTTSTTDWIYTCQHGPTECYGNAVEACGNYYYSGLDFWNWVICLETAIDTTGNFDDAGSQCATTYNLDYSQVEVCANGDLGNSLVHAAAVVTEALIPAHQYVPWVVVDGEHNVASEGLILTNILSFICNNYQGPKSPSCA